MTAELVASEWAFYCARRFNGRADDDERGVVAKITNLVGLGIPLEQQLAEIRKPSGPAPEGRDRSEKFEAMQKRLLERKPQPTVESDEEYRRRTMERRAELANRSRPVDLKGALGHG